MKREHGPSEDFFAPIDVYFARTLMTVANETNPLVEHVIRMVSHAARNGDVCVHLVGADIVERYPVPKELFAPVNAWRRALEESSLFGDGSTAAPLVLDDSGRVYLQRFWRAQSHLLERIVEKSVSPDTLIKTDDTEAALVLAAHSRFMVVTGGPGSGKTTLVATVLASLLKQSSQLRIAACAPTGKAAVRLRDAMENCRTSDAFRTRFSPAVCDGLPGTVSTIHKLLSPIGTTGRFRYTRDKTLPVDVLVVDEASMVDLRLMSALFDAAPREAKVILLGDQYQLSSIEPGRVLGDICFGATLEAPVQNAAVARCVVSLNTSYRFTMQSSIGRLAKAINAGDANAVVEIATRPNDTEISFVDVRNKGAKASLTELAEQLYTPYIHERTPESRLATFEKARLLCSVNHGPFGVETLNRLVAQKLAAAGLVHAVGDVYEHQPVIITQNDYSASLFNGDVGVICKDSGRLMGAFRDDNNSVRKLPVSLLRHFLPAYAMTIHKSQGSEFDHVVIVLPADETLVQSSIFSRELLYTAVTRARKKLTLFATEQALRHCVDHPTRRAFSLGHRLWGREERDE
ncbi:MAG: exodeoxyribonuclease V subunit alpha [Deltaproteobacteria bacterium]|nr:exodeoxyribonuclease V subunit alpha [Deltaproteobacteria bacterium]